MKKLFILFGVIFLNSAFSKSLTCLSIHKVFCDSQIDTLKVINKRFISVKGNTKLLHLFLSNDTLFIVSKKNADNRAAWDLLLLQPYCIFYDKKNRIIEAGRWY